MPGLRLVATLVASSAYLGSTVTLRGGGREELDRAALEDQKVAVASANNTSNDTSLGWYKIWGKDVEKAPTGPRRQWKLPAEAKEWDKQQTIRRARRMAPTRAYSREMAHRTQASGGAGRAGDDADKGDSVAWRSYQTVDEDSAFWMSLCNATDQAQLNAEGAEAAAKVAKEAADNLTASVASEADAAVKAAEEEKVAKGVLDEKIQEHKAAEANVAANPSSASAASSKDAALTAESTARVGHTTKAEALAAADKALKEAKAQKLCTIADGSATSALYPCFCGPTRGPTCKQNEFCTMTANSIDSKCALPLPLDPYDVNEKTTCASGDLMKDGKKFTSELDAYEQCGAGCSGVLDVGCMRKEFKLCKMGSVYEDDRKASVPDCIRQRVPNHPPPTGKARPPVHLSFWKTFCGRSVDQQNRYRILFSRRLCAAGKEIADAWTENKCAELVKADADCSEVFDYQYVKDAPNVCRCVKKNEQCNAAVPTGAGLGGQNVFIIQ